MTRPKINLKSPFFWLVSAVICSSGLKLAGEKDYQQFIRSDGRGYYAYLPATLIYDDPSFQKSLQAELKNAPWKGDPLYLYPSKDGAIYNKYFPGIAILQAPFFGMACATSWVTGNPIDGYSNVFHFWNFVGSVFYSIIALLLFRRIMRDLFPSYKKAIDWWIPCLFASTTLLFYCFETPSFTHHYSFFLFSLACFFTLKLKNEFSIKNVFILGLIFGLIFLVRPTNVLFLFFLPFLFDSKTSFLVFFKKMYGNYFKGIFVFAIGFLAVAFLLFLIWKWESGSWILWSYSGEGFNFGSPKIWQNLFSWRIGLLIHSPIFILFFASFIYLWKNSTFRLASILTYFVLMLYVTSSWWCWDYESPFSNRPFTEHAAFLLLPVFAWMNQLKKMHAVLLLGTFSILGMIRFYQIKSADIGDQRFVSGKAYFESLLFWKPENHGRYNFGRSCPPFGRVIQTFNLFSSSDTFQFDSTVLYGQGGEVYLPEIEQDERYYYQISLDKWQNNAEFNEVYLMIDAYSQDSSHRFYRAIPLFHDKLEAKNSWKSIAFSGLIEDNFKIFRNVKIYIFNPGKKVFKTRNVRIGLERYGSGI